MDCTLFLKDPGAGGVEGVSRTTGNPMNPNGMPLSGTKKVLLVGVAALVLLQGVDQAQFKYVVNSGTVTITQGYCSQGAVIIPETINGLRVTSIGEYAFSDCRSLRRVYFEGKTPGLDFEVFGASGARIYHVLGRTGWGEWFGDCPTRLWDSATQVYRIRSP